MPAERESIDWDEARRLYEEQGWTYVEVARHFGYSPVTVRQGLLERGTVSRRRRKPTKVDGRLRTIWRVLRDRCEDPAHSQYRYYGAKGARLCRTWAEFEEFRRWGVESGYEPGQRLVRVHRGRPYSPGNCRWVSVRERVARRKLVGEERGFVLISAFGETRSAEDWARDRRCSVGPWTVLQRLRRGYRPEDAVALPPRARPVKLVRSGSVAPPPRRKAVIDWDLVRRLHHDEGFGPKQIADRLGVSYTGILDGMKRHGIYRRRRRVGREEQRLRQVWLGVRSRCHNPDDRQYAKIGGAGVRMCKAWQRFEPFLAWAREVGARTGLLLTRIDRRKNYTPANCHWVTRKELARSRRAPAEPRKPTRLITAFGERKGLMEWTRDPRCSVSASTISRRLRLGSRPEAAISEPPEVPGCRDHAFRLVEAFDETKRFMDWVRDPRCKVGYGGLWQRLAKGWSAEDAIATPAWEDPISGATYPRRRRRRSVRRERSR